MFPPARVLAAVDFSESSRIALDCAGRLARHCDAGLHLVHVPTIPVGVIRDVAHRKRCDVILVGTHGTSGDPVQPFGPPRAVASRVLMQSQVPLLVHCPSS
jgi:nucleotide-binding universal stress UspA family protein